MESGLTEWRVESGRKSWLHSPLASWIRTFLVSEVGTYRLESGLPSLLHSNQHHILVLKHHPPPYLSSMGTRHRREHQDDPLHFTTTACHNWFHLFSSHNYFEILRDSMIFCIDKYEASLCSYVFMPNHIHLILYYEKNYSSKESKFSKYGRIDSMIFLFSDPKQFWQSWIIFTRIRLGKIMLPDQKITCIPLLLIIPEKQSNF